MKVLSALQDVGHPRDSKRISMLQEAGFEVTAACFERSNHAGRPPSCHIEHLGHIQNGQYIRRVIKIGMALPKVRKLARENHAIYASGLDMAILTLLATAGIQRPIILEVGDIRRVQVSQGLKGKVMRMVDKWVAKRCKLIVITAAGFETWYYREILGIDHSFLLMENKLEASSTIKTQLTEDRKSSAQLSDTIRIGYFGVLRCKWSIAALAAIAEAAADRIEIKIAGYPIGTEEELEIATKLANLTYIGTYKSPVDLPDLYEDVDLMWACYPGIEEDSLWRTAQLICRSNRFYESCCYKTPIITLRGSGDAQDVVKYDIGCQIDDHNVKNAVKKILAINQEHVVKWQTNMRNLPRSVFEYHDESNQLKKAILEMIE